MKKNILQTPIEYLKGVGTDKSALLRKELEISTFEELLHHFPFRYVDKSSVHEIAALQEGMPFCQVVGTLEKVETIGKGNIKRMRAILRDHSGSLELVWFKGLKWIQQSLVPGMDYLVFGKPTVFKGKVNIVHPEMEQITGEMHLDSKAKLQPVYPATEKLKARGMDTKGIARLQRALLDKARNEIEEVLPAYLLQKFKLMARGTAFEQIHFPKNIESQKMAENRLKFEELFFIQLRLLRQKSARQEKIKGYVFSQVGEFTNTFYKLKLPFELTNAQKRVIREIREDTRTGRQMNRLLQGDVGSGKTIVALMSMLVALDNGMQACLIAPTEILATQHYQSISSLTDGLWLKIRLLTGSTTKAERRLIEEELKTGNVHIIIGTHAVLEDWVRFPKLGMAVIDEQHKFGVAQRAALWTKSDTPPHVLIMTATPIPRTLAMTLYGDLDTSVLDEMPPGRKEIQTAHRFEKHRAKVFGFMRKQIEEGRQVYVVYPLIEESETLDYNNLFEGYEAMKRDFPSPKYHLSIVHGRMSSADKEYEMQRFKKGETQILVGTTVIEVGVDVPNATVMVIESAERFGLSQLHQLRGRVGRGGNQSYCILLTGYKLSEDARIRMETMVRTNNGFEIADVDLRLRGPGDMSGTQQSGVLNLKLADLIRDQKILVAARHAAMEIADNDPKLKLPEHAILKVRIRQLSKNQPNWGLIS